MNNNYIIRKLNENDYENYLKLINHFRPTKFTKDKYLEILNKINTNSQIWVIELNNELVNNVFPLPGLPTTYSQRGSPSK